MGNSLLPGRLIFSWRKGVASRRETRFHDQITNAKWCPWLHVYLLVRGSETATRWTVWKLAEKNCGATSRESCKLNLKWFYGHLRQNKRHSSIPNWVLRITSTGVHDGLFPGVGLGYSPNTTGRNLQLTYLTMWWTWCLLLTYNCVVPVLTIKSETTCTYHQKPDWWHKSKCCNK